LSKKIHNNSYNNKYLIFDRNRIADKNRYNTRIVDKIMNIFPPPEQRLFPFQFYADLSRAIQQSKNIASVYLAKSYPRNNKYGMRKLRASIEPAAKVRAVARVSRVFISAELLFISSTQYNSVDGVGDLLPRQIN
jgi:hypothetical protein